MARKKTNPNKIPKTQADVDRAEGEGRLQGMEFMANLMLFLIKENSNASTDYLRKLSGQISFYCEQVSTGEIKWKDIISALEKEHDVIVRLS